jgi:hypothetical protein
MTGSGLSWPVLAETAGLPSVAVLPATTVLSVALLAEAMLIVT